MPIPGVRFWSLEVSDHLKYRESYSKGSAECSLIFENSVCCGLISQFDSVGARAEGTMRMAARRSRTNRSPISTSSGGDGLWRQLGGKCFEEIELRETLSGTSAVTAIRSFGGSSGSICMKYSIIASERCSAVYTRRVPAFDQRPPKRYAPSPSNGLFANGLRSIR